MWTNTTCLRNLPALLGVAILTVFGGCTDSGPAGLETQPEPITLMSWNLYVGADLNVMRNIESSAQIPVRVAEVWRTIHSSSYPQRAKIIAQAIATERPHLIGLQEVALFRLQSPGDAIFGGMTPATTVVLDFLAILLQELNQRGASYRVVSKVATSDIEAPMLLGLLPEDLRLTDHEVILARRDVGTSNVRGATYESSATMTGSDSTQVVTLMRGWAAVEATIGNIQLHFVGTHLQTEDEPQVQLAQMQELIQELESEERPVFLVGDLNSAADGSNTMTYEVVKQSGFLDLWTRSPSQAPGFTCCQDADLRNPESSLSKRIDFILLRSTPMQGAFPDFVVDMRVLGAGGTERTSNNLWSSDHAGLVARFRAAEEEI